MSKINKTPVETRLAIERRSAAMLPDRPTQAGLKPWDIRNALFSAIIADKGACIMGEIDRIVDEANAAIDALRIKSGTLTVPMSHWKGEETPRAECVVGTVYTAGCAVFFMPEDDETKEQARLARLSMAINETVDGEWSDLVVFVGEGGDIPSVDLHFRYIVIPTESEADAIVALVGVDAYGEGGGGTGSGVDEEAVKALIGKEVPEWAMAKQKPTYTADEVKARPATWTPTAAEVGARPSTWMPTADEVGARPNTWMPTPGEVGAESAGKVKDHNEDSVSHTDIRLDITTLRTMLNTVIGTDSGKSMRAVAALVVAEIVGDASDSFDTLEEIAAWIEAHPNDVAAMVKRITDLETAMGGKVSKTDIINTLDSTALDKPLSAAMGAQLNAMLAEMSDELDGKATTEQVAKAISDALTGYALKEHNHDGTYAKPADIPQNLSQLAEDSTHRTVTDAEKTGWSGKADGDHNHDVKYAPVNHDHTVDEISDFDARVEALIIANDPEKQYVVCAEIPDDADTSKKYVPSDGYIYVYEQRTVDIIYNANDGASKWCNTIPATYNTESYKQGVWTSPCIEIDQSKIGSTQAVVNSHPITIDGLEKLVPAYNSSALWVGYYKADGTRIGIEKASLILGTSIGADGANISLSDSLEFSLYHSNFYDTKWQTVAYIRVVLGIAIGRDITTDDIKNLQVKIDCYNRTEKVWGWYSTGQKYTADENVMKNTADITELGERMTSTEEDVAGIHESMTEINTNSVLYAVGDSITYGSGADGYGTINAGWVKHVIARNGYDTSNSKNLGVSGIGFVQTAPGSTKKLRDIVDSNSFAPADDVIVAAGINDWKNWQITLDDFWAEMKYCLTKIRTDNPYCRIFYVLPYNCKASGWTGCTYDSHWALGYKGDSSAEKCFGYILKDFRKLILDKFETDAEFKALGVHVISIMPITRGNIDQITGDGLHPNAEGYKMIGGMLAQIMALS